MGRRTAWWKNRRSSKPSHGGDPMAPLDTERNCAADHEVIKEEQMSMDPASPTCEQSEFVLKDGEVQIAAETNASEECEETKMSSTKVAEVEVEEHTEDECTDHPPGVSEDVQSSCSKNDATEEDQLGTEDVNDDAPGLEIQAEVGNDDSTYGDEIHDVERTATGDSNEDTADYSSAARSIDSSQNDTSEYATVAMTVNTSKTDNTDYTDDGILRDDEGNPVDLAEAEENMLRDDEGNIIDPKTLVMREPFLVLCDEYCEDLEARSDDSRHESEIHHDTYVRFTIEAMVSEMVSFIEEENGEINTVSERCDMEESEEAPKEGCQEECAQEIDEANGEEVKEQESTSDGNAEPLLQGASPNRRPPTGRSRRRVRYGGRASAPQVNDDTVHIMFNNTLSTLVEESSVIIDEDSSEEDEKSHISYKSTRSEKFFKARWNYSLQVMRSEASTSKLIDARDEIDDMIRPKAYVPDDRSVCSDEGTI